MVRLGVLLLLLVLIGGAFVYDRFVLVPAGEETVKRVADVCLQKNATRDQVQAAAGIAPTSTETLGIYEVENYSFGRILPNLPGYTISVIYQDGNVTESITPGISDEERKALSAISDANAPSDEESQPIEGGEL